MRLNALTPAAGHKAAAAEDGTTEKAPPPGAYVSRNETKKGRKKERPGGSTPFEPRNWHKMEERNASGNNAMRKTIKEPRHTAMHRGKDEKRIEIFRYLVNLMNVDNLTQIRMEEPRMRM
jgi:hypothetical protein